MKLRTRLFFAAFGIAAVSLLLAVALVALSLQRQLLDRIESELITQTRLVAELVARQGPDVSMVDLDMQADGLGDQLGARVTLVASDGRVLGDSAEDGAALRSLENHGARPEIESARRDGLGVSRRFSTTTRQDLLYVAASVRHPVIGFVRVALPLTAVSEQVASVRRATAVGLFVALGGALALAWLASTVMSRRVQTIAEAAERYAAGDLAPPLNDYGQDEIGTVARALDGSVHELGRRLRELSRSRALTDAILSSMEEGVLVVDARGRIQLANQAVRHMLDIEESPVGHHYLELLRHPDISTQIGHVLDHGAAVQVEVALNTDPPRVMLVGIVALGEEAGDSRGVAVVIHDVTKYRRAEQVREDFVANVSHELRTPLTAIRGAVEALVEDDASQGSSRFLAIIDRQATRMERLVADLLRLVRLDAGQEALDLARCSLLSMFAGVKTELAPVLEANRQTIAVVVAPGLDAVVVDPVKLHDVLKNLVENAAHYAPPDSTIELGSHLKGDHLIMTVSDTGHGIPDAELSRVFERFYRVERSRVRNPGGTGLGLAIVKHLVGLQHGTVTAANRPGGGAVFTVTLPLDPEATEAHASGCGVHTARVTRPSRGDTDRAGDGLRP